MEGLDEREKKTRRGVDAVEETEDQNLGKNEGSHTAKAQDPIPPVYAVLRPGGIRATETNRR